MSLDAERPTDLLAQARELTRRYRLQLILALRVTVAAVLSLLLAQVLHLRLPLWAILTALIVTQMSLGKSVKVATDYLIGTLAGVAYGGAIAIFVPHESEVAMLVALALAVAPLAFVAAFRANFNVLPITAIIVLLVPGMQHVSPTASALDRVLEVTIGGAVGFAVSFLIFPSRALAMTTDAAANTLELMAEALTLLLEHHTQGLEGPDLRRLQDGIGTSIAKLNATGAEAEHERKARLTSGPDTGPLLRTLLRLRHDMVILGRAVGCELPVIVRDRLTPKLDQISISASAFLRDSAASLRKRRPPPALLAVDADFQAYIDEFGAVRHEGLTRDMGNEAAERFFALGFALEQMREHLNEVQRVVGEWARD
jgi:uncharacterized membrane protein YccC